MVDSLPLVRASLVVARTRPCTRFGTQAFDACASRSARCPRGRGGEASVYVPTTRDDVRAYLQNIADQDDTLDDPTDAMVDEVWRFCQEVREFGTIMPLAVTAQQRGESYALLRAAAPASGAALRDLLRQAVEGCQAAYHHLDRFGVVSGGSEAEHEGQEAVFDALRPFVSANSETRQRVDAALAGDAGAGECAECVTLDDALQALDEIESTCCGAEPGTMAASAFRIATRISARRAERPRDGGEKGGEGR